MLAREHRLTDSESFRLAVRSGRRVSRRTLVVHQQRPAEPSQAPARAGLIVGRSVGGAVVRNRVKRRLRAALREQMTRLPTGSLTVVRALPPAAPSSFAELSRDLDSALASLDDLVGVGSRP